MLSADAIVQWLEHYLLLPIGHTIVGLFDLNGRLGVFYLVISAVVAYYLYRRQSHAARSFGQFLGGKAVWWHKSARVDYLYYLLRLPLHLLVVAPFLLLLDPLLLKHRDVNALLTQLWGARPTIAPHAGLMALYGLGVFVLTDFVGYWNHRLFHCRWLWEFHKVHHSAAVLVPVTASRIHPFEKLVLRLLEGLAIALFAGVFFYVCGGKVSKYTLFNVSYLSLLFNCLAANLRHSHVWLSFGARWEHLLNSPAQHQIHHSNNPKHFNRNFGTNLSLWDWWFGTLYVTSATPEKLTFGVGPKDTERYCNLITLLWRPFWITTHKLYDAARRQFMTRVT